MRKNISLSYGADELYCELPVGAAGIRAGISLARAGDMDLAKKRNFPARARMLSAIGLAPERVFALRQVHSRRIVLVDSQDAESLESVEADGIITARRDAVLTVTVADCLPIYILDPSSGAFGLVHSGWMGTGIVLEAISLMAVRFGARPRDLCVTIGPGIGPCCYRVPEERCRMFSAAYGESAVARTSEGDCSLDLRGANVALLEGAGVEDIAVVGDCTCCSRALGSFRREGPERFTRMLAYMGRR